MEVRVINKSNNDLPSYETIGSAGCDVRSTHDATINPGHKLLVKTGLHVEIPIGYEIQVRPRSGLAFSKGLTVLNSPGTIDADYRGEIGVIIINHGYEQVFLEKSPPRVRGKVFFLEINNLVRWQCSFLKDQL